MQETICFLADDVVTPVWMLDLVKKLKEEVAAKGFQCVMPLYASGDRHFFDKVGYHGVIAIGGSESTVFGMDLALALKANLPVLLLHEKPLASSVRVRPEDWHPGLLQVSGFIFNEFEDIRQKCLAFAARVERWHRVGRRLQEQESYFPSVSPHPIRI